MVGEWAGGWMVKGVREKRDTHDVDELHEGQAELDVDSVGHVLYGPDELVIPSEEVPHQPLLILGTKS